MEQAKCINENKQPKVIPKIPLPENIKKGVSTDTKKDLYDLLVERGTPDNTTTRKEPENLTIKAIKYIVGIKNH